MRPSRRRSLALAFAGSVLALALVLLARPARIVALVGTASPTGVAVAFAWGCVVLLARGARLAALLAPRLPAGRATAVVALAQFAVGVLPLRLGELALPALLELAGVPGLLRGLAYALVVRLADVAALALWAVVAVLVADRSPLTVAALALLLFTVVLAAVVLSRRLPWLVGRWRRRSGLRRTLLRQVLQVRRELRVLCRSPRRALLVAAGSIVVWGGLWGLTASLLDAMGRTWPPEAVLASVVGAAVASSLPINAVGSFGSLEAGWTAAAVAFGVPAGQALADGFATHLWSLGFSLVLALPALPALALRRTAAVAPAASRARRTARRRNDGAP